MGKMMKGVAAGAMIGAAVSIMVLPQLDRKTQRNLKRTGKRAMGMAEDAYDTFMGYIK
ncbi:YtxH domain-containing protein [Clostridium septicum]|uniref:YtxH domain-containing protein n=1 Tax=Clostridium septicum TaxID=1504 RepID=A0ABY5B5B3_CLOSE|nr:YtxH domain-containing protein [Clostridium septicum]MDU1312605.1 YtxH domain-containing protein [Clostridium septicum]QAS60411.1 YtxH domain-containing protein [Clostridium septicum]UEC20332.1 YtxH domain-containing protein [Clostridium septicum]USS01616.1 YtxH domain-containing protein [Clostridium septicum]WLF70187.1 YtxH domain-containing protein [Clostridium septicum]